MTFRIPKRIRVRKLAALLGKTNLDIYYDVWAARGFKKGSSVVDFDTAAKVIRQYGHEAERME